MPLDSLYDPSHLYFITASTIDWIPLFQEEKYAEIMLDALSFFRNKREVLLFAFVLMSSHLHMIVKPQNITIGRFLQSFGSLTAHKMIKLLKQDGRNDILYSFHEKRRDPRSQYSVWQEIFSENIFTDRFLQQKMESSIRIQLSRI
jgi:REP element-mobilizing transposase RayT